MLFERCESTDGRFSLKSITKNTSPNLTLGQIDARLPTTDDQATIKQ